MYLARTVFACEGAWVAEPGKRCTISHLPCICHSPNNRHDKDTSNTSYAPMTNANEDFPSSLGRDPTGCVTLCNPLAMNAARNGAVPTDWHRDAARDASRLNRREDEPRGRLPPRTQKHFLRCRNLSRHTTRAQHPCHVYDRLA